MTMIKLRRYKEEDLIESAMLISKTFRKYNYKDNQKDSSEEYAEYYDPKTNLNAIRERFNSSSAFFVAEHDGQIVGVLRANENRIVNLFVLGKYHRQGIGKMLFHEYENDCKKLCYREIVLRSQLYSISFYQACGFKKTTGISHKHGLTIQPMKKRIHG